MFLYVGVNRKKLHTDVQQFNYIVKNKFNSLSKEKTPPAISPPFAPVGRCVASFRARQCSSYPTRFYGGFPPCLPLTLRGYRVTKKSRRNCATSPRSADRNRQWWGDDFTHPWVGQAERLACRERPPNAFLRAEARTHFPLTAAAPLLRTAIPAPQKTK